MTEYWLCTLMGDFVHNLQVVGKSCKPIPVMVLGVVLGRKSYSWKKYIFVLMIVIGEWSALGALDT